MVACDAVGVACSCGPLAVPLMPFAAGAPSTVLAMSSKRDVAASSLGLCQYGAPRKGEPAGRTA